MGVVVEVHEELVGLFRPVFRRQQLRPQPDRADIMGKERVEAVEVDFGVGKLAVLDRVRRYSRPGSGYPWGFR